MDPPPTSDAKAALEPFSDWSELPSILYIKKKQNLFTFRKWTGTIFKTAVFQDCVGFHSLRQRTKCHWRHSLVCFATCPSDSPVVLSTGLRPTVGNLITSPKWQYLNYISQLARLQFIGLLWYSIATYMKITKTVFSKMQGTLCEFDRRICELENLLIKKVFWQFFISISKKRREWRVFIAVLVSRQFAISDLKSRKGESTVNKSYRRFSDSDTLEFKELRLHG